MGQMQQVLYRERRDGTATITFDENVPPAVVEPFLSQAQRAGYTRVVDEWVDGDTLRRVLLLSRTEQ